MVWFEKRAFSLDHSLHINFSQIATYSLWRYRLVGHIFESLGYLHCIFDLAHSHYTSGIWYISRDELVRTATRGLGGIRTVFWTNFRDSTKTGTSLIMDSSTRDDKSPWPWFNPEPFKCNFGLNRECLNCLNLKWYWLLGWWFFQKKWFKLFKPEWIKPD